MGSIARDARVASGSTRGDWSRQAYLAAVCLLFATVVWGFWPSYWGRLLSGGVEHFWFVHLHAAVFLGWMAILLAQALLVTSGRLQLHRRLGVAAAAYGLVVLCVGAVVSIAAPVARVGSGQLAADTAALVALYNLTDIVVFGGFFMLAMRERTVPARHRRLVLCAGVALTGAAVGRVLPSGSLLYVVVWLAPLVIGMAVDWLSGRRIHPIFVGGCIAFAAMYFKVQIYASSPAFRAVGQTLIAPFL